MAADTMQSWPEQTGRISDAEQSCRMAKIWEILRQHYTEEADDTIRAPDSREPVVEATSAERVDPSSSSASALFPRTYSDSTSTHVHLLPIERPHNKVPTIARTTSSPVRTADLHVHPAREVPAQQPGPLDATASDAARLWDDACPKDRFSQKIDDS